jgi:hypothetical protein
VEVSGIGPEGEQIGSRLPAPAHPRHMALSAHLRPLLSPRPGSWRSLRFYPTIGAGARLWVRRLLMIIVRLLGVGDVIAARKFDGESRCGLEKLDMSLFVEFIIPYVSTVCLVVARAKLDVAPSRLPNDAEMLRPSWRVHALQ